MLWLVGLGLVPVFALSLGVLVFKLPQVGLVLGGVVLLLGVAFATLRRDSLTDDADAATGRYLMIAGGVIVAGSLTSRTIRRRRDRHPARVPEARAIKR